MSKATRIKGKFSKFLGCRITPEYREDELRSRKQGLTQAHKPTWKTTNFKLTKTQRKAFRALAKPQHSDHTLQRKATVMERGHGIYMHLVSLLSKPEAVRV